VIYFVDWGDLTNSGWTEDFASGTTITKGHMWLIRGAYTIKVKARDTFGEESDWAYLEVSMPVNQQYPFPLLHRFLDRFPNAFPILRHLLELFLHRKGLVIGILILMLGVNIGSTFAGDVDVKTMSSVGLLLMMLWMVILFLCMMIHHRIMGM